MSVANSGLAGMIASLQVAQAPRNVHTLSQGEAETPSDYLSFGGSLPSAENFGIYCNNTKIKEITYYNYSQEPQNENWVVTITILKGSTILETFTFTESPILLKTNISANGMIDFRIDTNTTIDLTRHRITLFQEHII